MICTIHDEIKINLLNYFILFKNVLYVITIKFKIAMHYQAKKKT